MRFYKLLLFVTFCVLVNYTCNSQNWSKKIYKKANSLKFKELDSSAYYYNKGYELSLEKKDTVKAINFLIELADLHGHNVNYEKSYDYYWQALLLADKSNDLISKVKIYRGLGWLYSFYKRDKEALKYFDLSLKLHKKLVAANKVEPNNVLNSYFSIINLYRMNNEFDMAQKYIDSSYALGAESKRRVKSHYLEIEKGYIEAVNGDYTKSIDRINASSIYFKEKQPSYLIVIYALLGDIYKKMNRFDESIQYYKKSLEFSSKYNRHLNYKMLVYESLANLYAIRKNHEEAYKYLNLAKLENDFIFGSRSKNNQHLLEIKDKFRIEKDKQQSLEKNQRIKELETEDKIWFLQKVILIVSFIFTLLFGYVFIRFLRNKHKNEKSILKEKQRLKLQEQELKLKQQSEILEIKNKELTESALRLIEKDELISSIEKRLADEKGNINANSLKRMLKAIKGSDDNNWEQFEARFTAVNQSFYMTLKTNFPKLTPADQKMCALVKLNMPSKHMAKLLGISVESVHSSRYRLRKKLGLSRSDNLEEFINSI
ncbi:Tetratricopeptide repeat-containing protein [Lutibacter oricola]|uniref:Tetratricopeptide repeat-containing protein n=1 Tax=Lutibacter oricola TaxID=762486 RepID=A0A1H3FG90_9FLAO|nr:tetratricopeptide repeat protein [Lutibacter oricola]SDX89398.1 Tetratricopeptide repeat-containing protein [Lutibacter oricola]